MEEQKHLRKVRSFVRREGRMSENQKLSLEQLWPIFGIDEKDEILDLDALFGRTAIRNLEIGIGNGAALLAMAEAHPEEDFIGIDVYRPGAAQVMAMAEQRSFKNIRIMTHDAVEALKKQIADDSLDNLYIFFPDPWHKKKHHKRRLVQTELVGLLARKLKVGGHLYLATDWENYAVQMLEVIDACPAFENTAGRGSFAQRNPRRPITKFENRGQKLGHGVWDLDYIKKPA